MDIAGVTNPALLNPLLRAQSGARSQGVGGRTLVVTPVSSESAALAGASGTQRGERAVAPNDARLVAPAGPSQQPAPALSRRSADAPVSGTAFQRNADGDSVTLESKEGELTESERRQVEELQARDREVRTHEQAHVAAAGPLFRGGPYYTYKTGPDGKQYAVGGSVSIDTSPGSTPEETIAKAQRVRQAAMAPAEPSSTDRSVAASAAQMEAQARQEMAQQGGAEGASGGPDAVDAAETAATRDTDRFGRAADPASLAFDGTDRDSVSVTQAAGQPSPAEMPRLDLYG